MAHRSREVPLMLSLDDIQHRAREIGTIDEPYRVAVAAAHDEAVIDAIVHAHNEGIAQGLLIGNEAKIIELLEKNNANPKDYQIINTKNDDESGALAASMAGEGKANLILKGILPTSKLLKNVLNRKYGLRRKGLLSHTAMLSPKRYPKLLGLTDGGMVIKPDFYQKVEMIKNAILVSWACGIVKPKVAVLTPIDRVVEAFPETFEAAALSKMAKRGQLKDCTVDGPMSFDTAIWPPAVKYQGIESDVAGQADIVLAGSIEEGNILAKSLIQFGGAAFAGVIIGANVPIALVSRADNAYNKLSSIALAVLVAHYIHEVRK